MIVIVVILAVGGGAFFFMQQQNAGGAAEEPSKPARASAPEAEKFAGGDTEMVFSDGSFMKILYYLIDCRCIIYNRNDQTHIIAVFFYSIYHNHPITHHHPPGLLRRPTRVNKIPLPNPNPNPNRFHRLL